VVASVPRALPGVIVVQPFDKLRVVFLEVSFAILFFDPFGVWENIQFIVYRL